MSIKRQRQSAHEQQDNQAMANTRQRRVPPPPPPPPKQSSTSEELAPPLRRSSRLRGGDESSLSQQEGHPDFLDIQEQETSPQQEQMVRQRQSQQGPPEVLGIQEQETSSLPEHRPQQEQQQLSQQEKLRTQEQQYRSQQSREQRLESSPVSEYHDNARQIAQRNWVLNVRAPARVFQIQVTPQMTANVLAACIQQILMSAPTDRPFCIHTADSNHSVAGLFAETTGVFLTLESILETGGASDRNMFCIRPPPPPPSQPKTIPWWQREYTLRALLIIPAIACLCFNLNWLSNSSAYALRKLASCGDFMYDSTVQSPLRELYRHGPWFLGWEGEPLARVCARFTYHGDEAFWQRNLDECERIFSDKEEAWLRIARPLLCLSLAVVLFYAVRMVLREWMHHRRLILADRHRRQNPLNRDMVETYNAIQVLLRQFQRTVDPTPQTGKPPSRSQR